MHLNGVPCVPKLRHLSFSFRGFSWLVRRLPEHGKWAHAGSHGESHTALRRRRTHYRPPHSAFGDVTQISPASTNIMFLTHGMFLISWYCRDSRILLHCFACTVKGSLITAGYPLEVIEKLPGSGNKREYKTKWSNCEPPEPDPSPASLDFPWQLPWLQDRGLDRVERSRGPLWTSWGHWNALKCQLGLRSNALSHWETVKGTSLAVLTSVSTKIPSTIVYMQSCTLIPTCQ